MTPPDDPAFTLRRFELPGGNFEGYLSGASISVIFEEVAPVGFRPRLHQHPYDETFILLSGSAQFTLGNRSVVGHAGQILVAPAHTPHTFKVLSTYSAVHIHGNDRFVTEWLE